MLVKDIIPMLLQNLDDVLHSEDKEDLIYNILCENKPFYMSEGDVQSCNDYVLKEVGGYLYEGYQYCFKKTPMSDVISLIRLIIEPPPKDYNTFLDNDNKYITDIKLIKHWDNRINHIKNKTMTDLEVIRTDGSTGLGLFEQEESPSVGINYRKEIEDVLKRNSKGLHVSDIAAEIFQSQKESIDFKSIEKKVQNICASDAKKRSSDITRVINPKTNKPKKGYYRFVMRKGTTIKIDPTEPVAPLPISVPIATKMTTTFEGKAGECAVMSELLWRGYNVNTFLVDDGVDVVASKNNMFYLLQVKTTQLGTNNRVSIALNEARFESFIGFNICYVIVVRSRVNNIDANLFFIFNNKDIARFINQKRIKKPSGNTINVKIKFINNIPYIYDEEDEDLSTFYLNNWSNL